MNYELIIHAFTLVNTIGHLAAAKQLKEEGHDVEALGTLVENPFFIGYRSATWYSEKYGLDRNKMRAILEDCEVQTVLFRNNLLYLLEEGLTTDLVESKVDQILNPTKTDSELEQERKTTWDLP
jgi:hypothetical protein